MGYGIWKAHHGIMKSTALQDYNKVKVVCQLEELDVVEPNGKHWHRIEDATATMLKSLKEKGIGFVEYLNRGIDYYFNL